VVAGCSGPVVDEVSAVRLPALFLSLKLPASSVSFAISRGPLLVSHAVKAQLRSVAQLEALLDAAHVPTRLDQRKHKQQEVDEDMMDTTDDR
jgi:hypothetical protein